MPPLGTVNNPKGRGKGIPNKITKEIRSQISDILAEHFTPEKVAENLQAMEPKDRLIFLTKLLDYTTPKLQSTQMEISTESTPHTIKIGYGNLTALADEELKALEKI